MKTIQNWWMKKNNEEQIGNGRMDQEEWRTELRIHESVEKKEEQN